MTPRKLAMLITEDVNDSWLLTEQYGLELLQTPEEDWLPQLSDKAAYDFAATYPEHGPQEVFEKLRRIAEYGPHNMNTPIRREMAELLAIYWQVTWNDIDDVFQDRFDLPDAEDPEDQHIVALYFAMANVANEIGIEGAPAENPIDYEPP
jgi:hypothetical protein